MNKYSQSSIYDSLFKLMPDLYKSLKDYKQNVVSKDSADILYNIWKNPVNKVSNKIYNKPSEMPLEDIKRLEKEGLVLDHHGKVQITAKGSDVLKTMILGDNRSCFEDDGTNISYKSAKISTETSSAKLRKQGKIKEDEWWSRF